jgi:hypothetical protein
MIPRAVPVLIAALIASFLNVQSSIAAVLPTDTCTEYNNAVEKGANIATPVVPDRLLASWQDALTCLVPIIQSLSPSVTSPKFSPEVQSKFLSATGAIRTLMTNLSAADKKYASKQLDQLIGKFNALDNLDVVSVLSYGARSDIKDMRVNSVLILGNIISNKTTCVPLSHLNDPTILDNESGINGRANLLAIVSVVAPRAKKQNYESIRATHDAIDKHLAPKTNPDLKDTYRALEEIQKKIDNPVSQNSRDQSLSRPELQNCWNYIEKFKLQNSDNLKYFH